MKRVFKAVVISVVWIFCGLCGDAFGYGSGDISVHLNGGDDVAYIGEVNTLEIWIANDALLIGMEAGFEITFATSLSWDMGYGSHPPVNEEGRAVDCWMLPDLTILNDFDNVSPDQIFLMGAAMPGLMGLPAASSELCYTIQFSIPSGEPETNDGISIVPCAYPGGGTWTFVDVGYYPPDFNGSPTGSETNPVAPPATFNVVDRKVCGDVNCDFVVNLADAVYTINYVFKGGPAPCAGCP